MSNAARKGRSRSIKFWLAKIWKLDFISIRTYCCNKYNYFTCGAVLAVWWSAWSLSIPMIEFKSRSSLHIFLNVKYWVGLFKKLCPLLLRHCQDLFKISFNLDLKKFMSSKSRNTKSEDIFPLLHYYVYSQAMNIWIN